ncbi:MAG: hypothetical protein CMC93_01025 [Flavobacteriaceae bacterium]|nr:hypothetical protein [Flavobacteriaceae bacterium]
MKIWKYNIIISDIPWEYYLHPCPKFYGFELAKRGITLWVNPPSRNPFKIRIKKISKNLIILTPWMFTRPLKGAGFDRVEVRFQVKLAAKVFQKKISSLWSISTAYCHLLKDFPTAVSIFWSGDFFSPKKEFNSYKEFDLVLCLTPPNYLSIPESFKGKRMHFNMSCDLNIFQQKSATYSLAESFANFSSSGSKLIGYIGTLSSRRIDYTLVKRLTQIRPKMRFIFVGKGDGLESTNYEIKHLAKRENVLLLESVDYENVPFYIRKFDACLIPYQINEANWGTCPCKFVEYCAIGKPIISTSLPGLTKFSDLAKFADSAENFADLIDQALSTKREKEINLQKKFAEESSASNFLVKIENIIPKNKYV